MDEPAIQDRYLELFTFTLDLPALVSALQDLRNEAAAADLDIWIHLIDARLARAAGRSPDALPILDAALSKDPRNPYARLLKAVVLSEDPESRGQALALHDALLADLKLMDDLPSRYLAAMALVGKSATLGGMQRPQEALTACDEALHRFSDSPELALRKQVARALLNKVVALRRMQKPREALATLDEVLKRLGEYPETPLREAVGRALVSKGIILDEMQRPQEALAAFDDLIKRFGDAEDSSLRAYVGIAQAFKARLARTRDDPHAVAEAETAALKAVEPVYSDTLRMCLRLMLDEFAPETIRDYFSKMEARTAQTNEFLVASSRFAEDASFLMILREWNSYTPAIPTGEEKDRGGGYFVRHAGVGIVIDPGYDFIQNFYRAGGVLADVHCVVITHAHDDHTAELEQLLMLLHKRRDMMGKDAQSARVRLYLSEGAQRKFAGLVPLRDDARIESVATLSRPTPGSSQRITISDRIALTVLTAYHDDVLTRDTTVGLGFWPAPQNLVQAL